MKKKFFTLCIIMLSSTIRGQIVGEPDLSFTLSPVTIRARHYNFGFENVAVRQSQSNSWRQFDFGVNGNYSFVHPAGWHNRWNSVNYVSKLDSVVKRSGRYSALIEPITESNERNFGMIDYSFPAIYSGKTIEVRAWFKGEGTENVIDMFMRIDGGQSDLLLLNNMERRNISAPEEWTEYSLTMRLPEEAAMIYIGAGFSGKGKLWIDDFRVLIDGIDIQHFQTEHLKYRAFEDNEFDDEYGSTITFGTLTPMMTENLAALAKVWGFAKYYHPTVASGEYNWDYVLFRAMGSMLVAQNADERNIVLYRLLDGLGSFRTVRRLNFPNSNNIKVMPDWDWMDDFGEDISRKLNEIKMARRDNSHFYIRQNDRTQAPVFRHEDLYPYISMNDDGFRMLGLFRLWNIVQYWYPYRYRLQENWHDLLVEFIPKVARADASNYQQTLTDLVLRIGNPQVLIASNSFRIDANRPLVLIEFVENKPVVTEARQSAELEQGDVIIKIAGKPVEELVEEKRRELAAKFVWSSRIDVMISDHLLSSNDDFIQVEYLRNEQIFTARLRCYPPQIIHENRINEWRVSPQHKWLTDEIGYFNSLFFDNDNDLIAKTMNEFGNTKGIIFDLRYNTVLPIMPDWRNTMISLGDIITRFLMSAPVEFTRQTRVDIQIPGLIAYSAPQRTGSRNRNYYSVKIVVLINQYTCEVSERTAMMFRALPNAVILGSVTPNTPRSTYLLTSWFNLPGNISGQMPGIGMYYPNGEGITFTGIIPDIEVKPTIRGIIEGRDEVLEKAIQIILD